MAALNMLSLIPHRPSPCASRHGQLLDEETHAPPIDRSHLLEGVKKYTYLFYDGAARMLSRYNYEDVTTPKSYCLPSHASAWARSSRMRDTYAADARVLSTI